MNVEQSVESLKAVIRDVPDFPKPGIMFKDITTLLKNPTAFRRAMDLLTVLCGGHAADKILAIESRGFIVGSALADRLGLGFVPLRKPGKLPANTIRQTYKLEYGEDCLEIHADAINRGDRVLIIGEGIAPAGWDEDMAGLVGPEGEVRTVEIILEGRRRTMEKQRGRKGVAGTWQWTYTFDDAPDTYDAVAILQSTQHCDDWEETSTELIRVLKPGRRIVLAEAVLVGSTIRHRMESDVHLRQWYEKALGFVGIDTIPYTSGEELRAAFEGKLTSPQVMEWHGIEMFWGRKPA